MATKATKTCLLPRSPLHPAFSQAAPGLACTGSPSSLGIQPAQRRAKKHSLYRALNKPLSGRQNGILFGFMSTFTGHKGLYVPIKQNSCEVVLFQHAMHSKMLLYAHSPHACQGLHICMPPVSPALTQLGRCAWGWGVCLSFHLTE